jgi:hypothetical protein
VKNNFAKKGKIDMCQYSRFGLVVVFVVLFGCGQTNPYDTVYVEGVVKLDGVLVSEVNVNFEPINGEGNTAGGLTDSLGKFKLTTGGAPFGSGAIAAEYNVTFSKTEVEGANLNEEEYKKQIGSRQPNVTHLIPEKYNNPSTSGINPVKVEKGKPNKFNFDLTTK